MELRDVLAVLLRRGWVIGLGIVVGLIASYIVTRTLPPIYQASTTLLVNQASAPGVVGYTDILTSERLTRTFAEWLTKRPILEQVIRDLDLAISPERLATAYDVKVIRDTQFILITVEHPDPHLARAIANRTAEIFIERYRDLQSSQYEASRQRLSAQISALEEEMRSSSARIDALVRESGRSGTEREAELQRLRTLLTQQQTVYASLLKSQEDLRQAEARGLTSLIIVEPAVTPLAPVKPRLAVNLLVAGLVGLLIGVALVLLLEYLDDTVKSPEDVQRTARLHTLGVVWQRRSAEAPLPVVENPRSPAAETYRLLRTNIQFAALERPLRTLLVTSSHPSEGKTTTLANLACAFAQAGRRVVAVDSDLRRPSLHALFDREAQRGLTSALIDDPDRVLDSLVETDIPGLSILPAGPVPPNPSELLQSRRMDAVLERLTTVADIVLLDSPPLLPVADGAILASKADGVVLVVEAARTRPPALGQARTLLEQAGASILGVVLNKVRDPQSVYYAYYSYRYYAPDDPTQGNGHRSTDRPSAAGSFTRVLRRLGPRTRNTER